MKRKQYKPYQHPPPPNPPEKSSDFNINIEVYDLDMES